MQPNSILAIAPSFSSYSSAQFAEIAAKVIREIRIEEEEQEEEEEEEANTSADFRQEFVLDPPKQREENDEESAGNETDDDDGDFEFTFVCQDPNASTISADEIFSNGQIRPIYPIFNRDLIDDEESNNQSTTTIRLPLRKLLIDGRDPSTLSSSSPSTSSSSSPGPVPMNGATSGTYCIWTPKSTPPATPDRCKKSNSTGSSKRWRFRDLLNRSSSDGKETFVFLSPSAVKRGDQKEKADATSTSTSTSTSSSKGKSDSSSTSGKGKTASAHEMHYVRNRKMREGDRRRSYLPYRQDLVGFFANVNGLSRSFHPI